MPKFAVNLQISLFYKSVLPFVAANVNFYKDVSQIVVLMLSIVNGSCTLIINTVCAECKVRIHMDMYMPQT